MHACPWVWTCFVREDTTAAGQAGQEDNPEDDNTNQQYFLKSGKHGSPNRFEAVKGWMERPFEKRAQPTLTLSNTRDAVAGIQLPVFRLTEWGLCTTSCLLTQSMAAERNALVTRLGFVSTPAYGINFNID